MIRKKSFDGVIVAARYTSEGEIKWVRAFERHGFVFSDRIIMDRSTLEEKLRAGKKFKTGERLVYQGNDFDVWEDIKLLEQDEASVIVAGDTSSKKDFLGDLPII